MDVFKNPVIKVLNSHDEENSFEWVSVGWYDHEHRGCPEAKELMAKAEKAIGDGETVAEVIQLLQNAGFTVI